MNATGERRQSDQRIIFDVTRLVRVAGPEEWPGQARARPFTFVFNPRSTGNHPRARVFDVGKLLHS